MSIDWKDLIESGTPLREAGLEVIDAHAHLGAYFNFYVPRPGAEQMVAVMDRLGMARACISSNPALGADVPAGNELTAAAVHAYPDRFIGYACVNPHYPERVRPELERAFDELGLRLIKLHPTIVEYPISGSAYEPVWRFASERRAVILTHTWQGTSTCAPGLFGPIAQEYPDVAFILGHSGGTPAGYVASIELAQQYDNVYLDLCRSEMSRVWVERMVREVGAQRVLWGTDFPFLEPRYLVGRVARSALNDEAKRLVFGQSARRLFEERGVLP